MDETGAIQHRLQLEQRFRSGANWFFWIAGLSLLNSVMLHSGSNWSFIVGLGITRLIDAVALNSATGPMATAIALALDAFVAGFFVLFGVLARKRYIAAFVIGMILYAADGLLFLMVKDWLSMGFHVLALVFIFKGLTACRELTRLEADLAAGAAPPPPEMTEDEPPPREK